MQNAVQIAYYLNRDLDVDQKSNRQCIFPPQPVTPSREYIKGEKLIIVYYLWKIHQKAHVYFVETVNEISFPVFHQLPHSACLSAFDALSVVNPAKQPGPSTPSPRPFYASLHKLSDKQVYNFKLTLVLDTYLT